MPPRKTREALERFYALLSEHYGPTHWWPGETQFEIAIGAILTQNAAWTNVEKAIDNLKRTDLLSPTALLNAPLEAVEEAVHPSGFFRVKAQRVRGFCQWLTDRFDGDMANMAKEPLETLRPELLAVHGIGPETADDILLYACDKPVFVIDAYTRRILQRHGVIKPDLKYEELRALFEKSILPDTHVYGKYHGLIVYAAKDFCKTKPQCEGCPLAQTLKRGQPRL